MEDRIPTPVLFDPARAAAMSATAALVGREAELAAVSAALADPACGAVVIRGPAGAGKTALARAALAAGAGAEGILVGEAGYEEGYARAPFRPILRALSELCGCALDQLYDPEAGCHMMTQVLGPALGVLRQAGFLPGAEDVLHPADLVGRGEGAARVVDAALRLVRWLHGFQKPLVLLIDDWARGSAQAQGLVSALAEESGGAGLTLVLTERVDIAGVLLSPAAHPLVLELGPLSPKARSELFARALGEAGEAVVRWFGAAGPLLPFDILAAARALESAGAVRFAAGGWTVDPAAAAGLGRDDLARALIDHLPSLGSEAAELALVVALWGEPAPLAVLENALDRPRGLTSAIEDLEAAGILRRGRDEVCLVHDRLRAPILAAAADRISPLAERLAERLYAEPPPLAEEAATTALHFRRLAGVDGLDPDPWRDRFANGSRRARAGLDIETAAILAETAWNLRERARSADPQADHRLVREAVLAAANRKDFPATTARIEALFALAPTRSPRGEDYELAIAAMRFCGETLAGWEIGRQGLARLGVRLPARIGGPRLALEAIRWRLERGLRRPRARRPDGRPVDALTRIANAAGSIAYEFSPPLAALVGFVVSRRASVGALGSPFWLANDTFLYATLGDYAQAARLGAIAVEELEAEGEAGFAHAASLYRALFWGVIWRTPHGRLREACRRVRDLAVPEGDIGQAGIALRNWVLLGWRSCAELGRFEAEIEEARKDAERLGARDVTRAMEVFAQAARRLRSPGAATERFMPFGRAPETPAELLIALELANLEGDFAYAADLAGAHRAASSGFRSHPGGVVWAFHECVARLKTGQPAHRRDLAYIRKVAALNPTDHRAKLLVVLAEAERRRRGPGASLPAFAEAVAAAEAGSCPLEAGLAAQWAADAAGAAGDAAMASHYQRQAQATWRAWGAAARLPPRPDDLAAAREADLVGLLAAATGEAREAERAARARSRFLADVAHELRTPMQEMQALIDLAAGEPEPVDLAALGGAFSSLRTVVDDLTDFGALASGEAPIALAPTQIADLVRSEAAVAGAMARKAGASIEVEVAAEVPDWIETDGARVRQVVRNLISNAIKYGGGALRLSAWVDIVDDEKERVVIAVEDEGPGLAAADLVRLFEPFERGGRAGDGRGLGLGLSLSRRIAVALGGELIGENRAQGGARFTLAFPLARAAEPAAAASGRAGLAILLVEDEALIRTLVARILRRQGHEVVEAADGRQALALRASRPFDLAIVDLALPGMGGGEVLARLAEAGPMPAIILSAASREIAEAAGAALVLRKPVSAAELAAALAKVLPDRPAEAFVTSERFAVELAQLADAARAELKVRVPALAADLEAGRGASPAQAHQIAGLAAQFGWPAIAEAADLAEQSLKCGAPAPALAARRLRKAVAPLVA